MAGSDKMRLLILGGTSEASALAQAVAEAGIDAVLSLAGRVAAPKAQPVAVRIGGFGGVQGLADALVAERITHIVDATHPFAAGMSRNAVAAAARTGVPLIAFERSEWSAGPGDDWMRVPDIAAAAAALAGPAQAVFLAIGRMHLAAFARQPQHRYLLRLVDMPDTPLALPETEVVIARGPFRLEDDIALLRAHDVARIVAKNSGGSGARAKIDAARVLGIPVVMIDRPEMPDRASADTLDGVMRWLGHGADLGV